MLQSGLGRSTATVERIFRVTAMAQARRCFFSVTRFFRVTVGLEALDRHCKADFPRYSGGSGTMLLLRDSVTRFFLLTAGLEA
ncbi:hypothetical protein ACFQ88_08555, partial [Paenibacillus sp. NPDC056579]|uniref:hypothetical protein n=1 Tax=Paenibacillus sp. NPDC056579 TaxID=3345871 RepID=UPI0036A987E1